VFDEWGSPAIPILDCRGEVSGNKLLLNSLLIPCFVAWGSREGAIHAGFRTDEKKFPVIFPVIGKMGMSAEQIPPTPATATAALAGDREGSAHSLRTTRNDRDTAEGGCATQA
jgi:hypothetical protein